MVQSPGKCRDCAIIGWEIFWENRIQDASIAYELAKEAYNVSRSFCDSLTLERALNKLKRLEEQRDVDRRKLEAFYKG